MREIRIQSDGMGRTTVITADDGTVLTGVQHAEVTLDAREINRVKLTIVGSVVDIHAVLTKTLFKCELCTYLHEHNCTGRR